MLKFIYIFISIICIAPASANDTLINAKNFIIQQQNILKKSLQISDKQQKFAELNNQVSNAFAIYDIYQFAAGRYAKNFNQNQQNIIIDFFKKNIILTYAIEPALSADNYSINVKNINFDNQSQKIIANVNIINSQTQKILNLDFILVQENQKFLIYDIKYENISMLFALRKMFDNLIQEAYGDVSAFTYSIQNKLQKLDDTLFNNNQQNQPEPIIIQ